jgi:hypothetical protein
MKTTGAFVSYPAPRAWIQEDCVCEEWTAERGIDSWCAVNHPQPASMEAYNGHRVQLQGDGRRLHGQARVLTSNPVTDAMAGPGTPLASIPADTSRPRCTQDCCRRRMISHTSGHWSKPSLVFSGRYKPWRRRRTRTAPAPCTGTWRFSPTYFWLILTMTVRAGDGH